MNGPEHYREAERLLGTVAPDQLATGKPLGAFARTTIAIQAAAVHAQLAQVAATIATRPDGLLDGAEWIEATSL